MINKILKVYLNHPDLLINTILLFFLGIALKLFYPKFRGIMGEFWVRKELEKLPKNKYTILNNIMLSDDFGTHQIDHIVLSNYGIFVIETKNYYGLIKGRDHDKNWCQFLGKRKYYFLNPIHQNYGHIKALSNLLNLDEKYLYLFVKVFQIKQK